MVGDRRRGLIDALLQFFSEEYMPHGHCYLWRPDILWTHVVSDSVIAIAYFSIPLGLVYLKKKRSDIQFSWLLVLFSSFILLCGLTHVYSIYNIWVGSYGGQGVLKAITALASIGTAFALIHVLPKVATIPTTEELAEARESASQETIRRIQLEAAHREEAHLREATNASPVGLLVSDERGNITLANNALAELFGYDASELNGQSINMLIDAETSQHHGKLVGQFLESEETSRVMASGRVVSGVRKDGAKIPVDIRLAKRESEGEVRIFAAVTDLSEKLAAQEEIREANMRFERITKATQEGLWEWNIETNTMWWSTVAWQLLGYNETSSHASMDQWLTHLRSDFRHSINAALQDHLQRGLPFDEECVVTTLSGEERWIHIFGNSVYDKSGQPIVMSGAMQDIQLRKDMELVLREKSQFLESIFQGTSYSVFVLDADKQGTLRYSAFNNAVEQLTGIAAAECLGKTPLDLAPDYVPEKTAQEIQSRYNLCYMSKRPSSYVETIEFKGRVTWWKTALFPLLDNENRVYRIIGSSTDITDLKHAEQKLTERESFLKNVVDLSISGLYIFNLKTNVNTFINNQYTRITGYTLEDLRSKSDLMQYFHSEEQQLIIDHIERVIVSREGEVQELEYRFKHKNGRWIWCRSFDAVFSRDEEGKPIEMIGTFIDVTSIKEYARRLEKSNEELERFVYVASHDLQEPLRKVIAFSSHLESNIKREQLSDEDWFVLGRIVDGASRMRDLITDMLRLSHVTKAELKLEEVELENMVESTRDMLAAEILETHASVELRYSQKVYVDRALFIQLLQNLVGNALKYRRPEVRPRVVIEVIDYIDESGEVFDQVVISDNGLGFDNSQASDIFRPFKRLVTRATHPGSGIGLAICEQIVKAHRGNITAEGRPNVGARIYINLPKKNITLDTQASV
ncbi:PAS/PAC sensor signal transduction histidine kinase [Saccharophagus degradans 2-40]|uniref:histidine kinase n=1 Tax=Saccharophagus degradans (strain 2-40 / ATCC 43961 / DSM 17024) TaxID=203122 RepID=Q21N05_SACD2|nr:PAS/PAC sensor signal transduction histidine kinase [Saccharophagus degradans 2-40]